jgi:DnaK suppressor protein
MPPTPQAIAAKSSLLQRRATLSALRTTSERDATALGAEARSEELAESQEIADVLVQLSAQETAELREVDAALKRLELGTWGRCEVCLRHIDTRRMKARPEARTCASCAPA